MCDHSHSAFQSWMDHASWRNATLLGHASSCECNRQPYFKFHEEKDVPSIYRLMQACYVSLGRPPSLEKLHSDVHLKLYTMFRDAWNLRGHHSWLRYLVTSCALFHVKSWDRSSISVLGNMATPYKKVGVQNRWAFKKLTSFRNTPLSGSVFRPQRDPWAMPRR